MDCNLCGRVNEGERHTNQWCPHYSPPRSAAFWPDPDRDQEALRAYDEEVEEDISGMIPLPIRRTTGQGLYYVEVPVAAGPVRFAVNPAYVQRDFNRPRDVFAGSDGVRVQEIAREFSMELQEDFKPHPNEVLMLLYKISKSYKTLWEKYQREKAGRM